jgi:hypothetical protein
MTGQTSLIPPQAIADAAAVATVVHGAVTSSTIISCVKYAERRRWRRPPDYSTVALFITCHLLFWVKDWANEEEAVNAGKYAKQSINDTRLPLVSHS